MLGSQGRLPATQHHLGLLGLEGTDQRGRPVGTGRWPPREPAGPSAAAPAPPTGHTQQAVGRGRRTLAQGAPEPVGGPCFTRLQDFGGWRLLGLPHPSDSRPQRAAAAETKHGVWATRAQGCKLENQQWGPRLCRRAADTCSAPVEGKGTKRPCLVKAGSGGEASGFTGSEL